MEFKELIDRLKNKDIDALSSLFNKYSAALNGIILKILTSEKQGEEILQQTFFKIWEEIDHYDSSKSTLFTWMSQIARNLALNAKHQNTYDNNKAFNKEMEQANKSNLIGIESQKLVKQLEEKHQLIIEYIYLRGYSQSKTAELLKIPSSEVKEKLRFATIELRKLSKKLKNLTFVALVFTIPLIKYLCL